MPSLYEITLKLPSEISMIYRTMSPTRSSNSILNVILQMGIERFQGWEKGTGEKKRWRGKRGGWRIRLACKDIDIQFNISEI